MHTPDFTRRFVRCAHCTLGKAGDAGVLLLNVKRDIMQFGIDLFCGTWQSKAGFTFEIVRQSDISASVSIYDQNGNPILRPYFDNRPTIDLPADYDDYNGEFEIYLWEKQKGFTMDLVLDYDRPFGNEGRYELVQSISRFEKDNFLDQYYDLFGRLGGLLLIS